MYDTHSEREKQKRIVRTHWVGVKLFYRSSACRFGNVSGLWLNIYISNQVKEKKMRLEIGIALIKLGVAVMPKAEGRRVKAYLMKSIEPKTPVEQIVKRVN